MNFAALIVTLYVGGVAALVLDEVWPWDWRGRRKAMRFRSERRWWE